MNDDWSKKETNELHRSKAFIDLESYLGINSERCVSHNPRPHILTSVGSEELQCSEIPFIHAS